MIDLLKRNRQARRLLAARLLSVWGDVFYAMAAMWTTYELTGSAWQMALISVAEISPYLLFGALGGALVDRWERRRLLITLDLIQGAVVAAVPLLHLAGLFSPWMLPVVGFLIATCRTLYSPAVSAYLPRIVDESDLGATYSLMAFAFRSGGIAVPLILGLFFDQIAIVPAFLLDAATFVASAMIFATFPPMQPAGAQRMTEKHSLLAEMRQGLQAITGSRTLMAGILACALGSVVRSPLYRFALPILATGSLQSGESGYKLLQLASGIGGVAGALLAAWVTKRWRQHGRTILGAWLFSGVGTVVVGLSPLTLGARGMAPTMAGLVVSALGTPIAYVAMRLALQAEVPATHLGRATGIFESADMAGDYGGVLLMPLMLTWTTPEAVFTAGGLLTMLFCIGAYMTVVRPRTQREALTAVGD